MPSYPPHLYSTLGTISAAISLVGSSAIIYVISKSREKLGNILNRLLVCLCIGDIMMSFALLFTKAIIQIEDRLGPDGEPMNSIIPVATNQAACNAQGFFFVAGSILSPFYNCALCVYYVCVIYFNYSDPKIKEKVEPFLHAVPWTWALFSAIYALASNTFNPNFGYCTIEPGPYDCIANEEIACKSGINAMTLRWVFQGGPLLAVFFLICGMMAVVYWTVWKQEKIMKGYDHRAVMTGGYEQSMIVGRRNQVAELSWSHRLLSLRQTVTNSRKVLNQALAYVGAYLCSFILVYVDAFILLSDGHYNDTILLLQAFFHPLQGFFNFMVFIFPRVTRQLRRNPNMNLLQAVLAAVQCKPLPPINRGGRLNPGGTPPAGGTESRNNRPRYISGLNGTPSSNGRHARGNRSGQETGSSSAAASNLAARNISSGGLETRPTNNSIKISFAEQESVTNDILATREGLRHQLPSILRKSHLSPSRASHNFLEDNGGLLPELKSVLDGSAALEFLPENETLSATKREEEVEGNKDIDLVGPPQDSFPFKETETNHGNEYNEDEETGFSSGWSKTTNSRR